MRSLDFPIDLWENECSLVVVSTDTRERSRHIQCEPTKPCCSGSDVTSVTSSSVQFFFLAWALVLIFSSRHGRRCAYRMRNCRPLVKLLAGLLIASVAASDWCNPSGAAWRLSLQLSCHEEIMSVTDSDAFKPQCLFSGRESGGARQTSAMSGNWLALGGYTTLLSCMRNKYRCYSWLYWHLRSKNICLVPALPRFCFSTVGGSHIPNPTSITVALASIQHLREMSSRNIFSGVNGGGK
jgi:hypothetical protein